MKTNELIKAANLHPSFGDSDVAKLVIDVDRIIEKNTVPGLDVSTEKIDKGIKIDLTLQKDKIIEKPVHLCFGITDKKAIQKIEMSVDIKENSEINIFSHCVFPNAVDIQHIMNAQINIARNSRYSYFERHVHSESGGINVIPKAVIRLMEGARLTTEFELMKGRVGIIDIDYEVICEKDSIAEMNARINGKKDDVIKIRETARLEGVASTGVLTSRVALRQNARAEVYNKLIATADYARGHVDCKEIVQDNAFASAVPIVEVNNPKAHVTHEASIGSVDSKQLQTLMSRGLDEDSAVEMIIDGLLS